MKITIDRSTLIERLSQVIKAIPKQITFPILEGVLIESNGEELTLTCSDSNFTIKTTLDEHEEYMAGATVIPALKLLEVIKKMPDKPIEIEVDGAVVIVKSGSTKVKLPALDVAEFPIMKSSNMSLLSISGNDFIRLAENTKYAVSTAENSPVIQGVCFARSADALTAIATDRHRLAKQSIELSGEDSIGSYVIPTRLLDAVAKLKPSNVEIGFSENEIYLAADTYQYTGSLYDGTYPDTRNATQQTAKTTVWVDTARLLQTLEIVEKIVGDKTKIAKFVVSEGELKVTAEYEGSSMEEVIEAEVKGDGMVLSVNAKYVIDALKCVEAKRVEIKLTGTMSPVLISGEGDESGLHLVLPYRTLS